MNNPSLFAKTYLVSYLTSVVGAYTIMVVVLIHVGYKRYINVYIFGTFLFDPCQTYIHQRCLKYMFFIYTYNVQVLTITTGIWQCIWLLCIKLYHNEVLQVIRFIDYNKFTNINGQHHQSLTSCTADIGINTVEN